MQNARCKRRAEHLFAFCILHFELQPWIRRHVSNTSVVRSAVTRSTYSTTGGLSVGTRDSSSAAPPATYGLANDVPEAVMRPPSLTSHGAVTVGEATRFSGIGRSSLYELMTAGELPFTKVGARRLIPSWADRVLGQHPHRHGGHDGQHLLQEVGAEPRLRGGLAGDLPADILAAKHVTQNFVAIVAYFFRSQAGRIIEITLVLACRQCTEHVIESALGNIAL